MVADYWRMISGYAWKDTVEILHLNSVVGSMAWLVGSLIVLAGLFFYGSADSSRDELLTRIFLAFATVSLIPFVFAYKMIRVPAEVNKDIRGWARELEDAFLECEQVDEAMFAVHERYSAGIDLLKRGVSEDDLLAWEKEFDGFIRENFEASCYLNLCAKEHQGVNYTVIYEHNSRYVRRDLPEDLGEEARIDGKLRRIHNNMPWIANYYRGQSLNKPQFMAQKIRQIGLREHRLPQDTE
jgi:hypothetical protein